MLWVERYLSARRQGCGVRKGSMPLLIIRVFHYAVSMRERIAKGFNSLFMKKGAVFLL